MNEEQTISWYVDASFETHGGIKSHTDSCMPLGKGIFSTHSTKQKVNSRSSTKTEIIDWFSKIVWDKRFIEAQGVEVSTNVICQYNQSTIRPE